MAPTTEAHAGRADRDLRRRAWRWHFLAALLVIPFVLWQSATGTLYLWSEAWVDARHPELRFVAPAAGVATLDAQVAAARAVAPGLAVANILLPADPARSTQVTFTDAHGLPLAVFVDPGVGRVLGRLQGRLGRWAGRAACTAAGRSATRVAGCWNSVRAGPS